MFALYFSFVISGILGEALQAIFAIFTIELVWKEKLLSHCRRDIVSVGKTLKQLRFMEKRIITMRLASVVRQFVEENDERSSPAAMEMW